MRSLALLAALALCLCGGCDCKCAVAQECPPGKACQIETLPNGYQWRLWNKDPDRCYLYINGHQVGAYDFAGNYFRHYYAGSDSWGPQIACPIALPGRRGPVMNFGVDLDKHDGPPEYTLHRNGGKRSLSAKEAKAAIEGKLVDDSAKLRVTVIGPKAEREQVVKDLATVKELQDWAIIRDYAPDHWAVKDVGFETGGRPTVYCQAPTGKVLHRQDDYAGGQAECVEALRVAKQTYDKRVDRDLRPSQAAPPYGVVSLSALITYIVSAVGGVFGGDMAASRK